MDQFNESTRRLDLRFSPLLIGDRFEAVCRMREERALPLLVSVPSSSGIGLKHGWITLSTRVSSVFQSPPHRGSV